MTEPRTRRSAQWPWLLLPVGFALLFFGAWRVAAMGRGGPEDGTPALARVLRAGDGNCWVGAKRQHCYRLELELHADDAAPRAVSLNVNIEDRFAYRVQPGAWLRVIVARDAPDTVFIDAEALAAPAPTGS